MTSEQIELVIELISIEAQLAAHPLTPPKHWYERREELQDELRQTPPAQPQAERELRKVLCVTYAGALAYMDDGEAQDSRANPTIDFMRDTPAEIRQKMQQRSLAQQPQAEAVPPGYAGVMVWIGAKQVTRIATETEIRHEREAGFVLKQAALMAVAAMAQGAKT